MCNAAIVTHAVSEVPRGVGLLVGARGQGMPVRVVFMRNYFLLTRKVYKASIFFVLDQFESYFCQDL